MMLKGLKFISDRYKKLEGNDILNNYETKESKKLKKELRNLDLKGVGKHIVFSIIVCMFLGSFYYFFRWKIIGALLLFFVGYGILGIAIVYIGLFVQKWGLKKIKEKEVKDHFKNDDLDF